jgi:hypothetical protein
MADFTLTEVEETRAKEFRAFIKTEFGARHSKKTHFQYIFSPNGIGIIVEIRDELSGETKDITDIDSW